MKAIDLLEFFFSKAPWINRETTVDRVIAGDPDKPVQRVLVTWMPSLAAVQEAIRGKYDLLLTHEPTFYDHRDYRDNPQELDLVPSALAKRKLINDAGLVIIRNHDVWDLFPEIGIPYAWAKFLGIQGKPTHIVSNNYMHCYDIPAETMESFTRSLAQRVATLGESAVQVCGRGNTVIKRIGIGTGCCAIPAVFRELGCDLSVVTDDGTWYWKHLQQAEDEGHPFIRVHHGTSEEPGMLTLTKFLKDNLPELEVTHLPHRPIYRTICA